MWPVPGFLRTQSFTSVSPGHKSQPWVNAADWQYSPAPIYLRKVLLTFARSSRPVDVGLMRHRAIWYTEGVGLRGGEIR